MPLLEIPAGGAAALPLRAARAVYHRHICGHNGCRSVEPAHALSPLSASGRYAVQQSPHTAARTRTRHLGPVSDNDRLALDAPLSQRGDWIVLRAFTDVVVIFSACPMDITPVNGEDRTPRSVAYEVLQG